jgi:hypothetical protein
MAYDTSTFTYTGQAAGMKTGGIYRITSKVSGKVLDIADKSYAAGSVLQQWTNYKGLIIRAGW